MPEATYTLELTLDELMELEATLDLTRDHWTEQRAAVYAKVCQGITVLESAGGG